MQIISSKAVNKNLYESLQNAIRLSDYILEAETELSMQAARNVISLSSRCMATLKLKARQQLFGKRLKCISVV